MLGVILTTGCLRETSVTVPVATVADSVYLRPQRRIAVDGTRRLNLYCTGRGAPMVLLDAGAGESMMVWRHVHWRIAARTRTCAYDRAGYGHSDGSVDPSDATHIVEDVQALLRAAAEPLPIVYVGHSAAGLYATLLVARSPDLVAGAVLIDPVVPRSDAQLTPLLTAAARDAQRQWQRETLSWLSRCAASGDRPVEARDTTCTATNGYADAISPALRAELSRQYARPATMRAAFSEYGSLWPDDDARVRDDEQVAASPADWASRPLVVLARDATADASLPGMNAASQRAFEAARLSVLAALAGQSAEGEMVRVPDTRHHIQFDQPESVINAVAQVVERVRQRPPAAVPSAWHRSGMIRSRSFTR